jgi:biotin carboxyl carrier protein
MKELLELRCPNSMSLDGSIYIMELIVTEGQVVAKNQIIAILESDNHVLEYPAEQDCIIEKIHCSKGQRVAKNEILFATRPK